MCLCHPIIIKNVHNVSMDIGKVYMPVNLKGIKYSKMLIVISVLSFMEFFIFIFLLL